MKAAAIILLYEQPLYKACKWQPLQRRKGNERRADERATLQPMSRSRATDRTGIGWVGIAALER